MFCGSAALLPLQLQVLRRQSSQGIRAKGSADDGASRLIPAKVL